MRLNLYLKILFSFFSWYPNQRIRISSSPKRAESISEGVTLKNPINRKKFKMKIFLFFHNHTDKSLSSVSRCLGKLKLLKEIVLNFDNCKKLTDIGLQNLARSFRKSLYRSLTLILDAAWKWQSLDFIT